MAQVEELRTDPTLTHSPRGELEVPRTTNDLAILMQGLMGMVQSLGPTPSSLGPISITCSSIMTLDTPHAPPNDRTIDFSAGKDNLWTRLEV